MQQGVPAWPAGPPDRAEPRQDWAPDLVAAGVVAVLGLMPAVGRYRDPEILTLAVMVAGGIALAVGLTRHRPALAVAAVWGVGLLHLVTFAGFSLVHLAIGYVAFGTARWGSRGTLWVSGLSLPVAVVAGVWFVGAAGFGAVTGVVANAQVWDMAVRAGAAWPRVAALVGLCLLALPWLAGLAARFADRAARSRESQQLAEAGAAQAHRESEQAREIAALREEQARLARDVHDVVGHSLAVILAQAESAQYLADDDRDAMRRTMAAIAGSARSSLQDIRQVLSGPAPEPAMPGSFEDLVAGVRASGHEVEVVEAGVRQPLPPELEVVAHRVVQEMLTNAIRHGRRDRPVSVERHWPDQQWGHDLRIEVRNAVDPAPAGSDTRPLPGGPGTPGGQGLGGMRGRLEAVGGRLDVRLRDEPGGPTFTVTAWIPVSGVPGSAR